MQEKSRYGVFDDVVVTIHINKQSHDTYALLDNGSQGTLLRSEFFAKFEAPGEEADVLQSTIKDDPEEVMVEEISFDVSARDGSNSMLVKKAWVQPPNMFNMPSRPRLQKAYHEGLAHLEDLSFESIKPEDICVLIGGNVPRAHLYDDVRIGDDDEPTAFKTPFGWTLFGPCPSQAAQKKVHISTVLIDEALDQSLESFWEEEEERPTVFINNLVMSPADTILHQSLETLWKQDNCFQRVSKD